MTLQLTQAFAFDGRIGGFPGMAAIALLRALRLNWFVRVHPRQAQRAKVIIREPNPEADGLQLVETRAMLRAAGFERRYYRTRAGCPRVRWQWRGEVG
jgi:hypothetical protein